ncbi:Exported protein [Stutzerimonas xanthomarina]|nr:Exported protein [Stutzerimonas xanthomarina]
MRIALLLSLMAVATTAQPAEPLRLQLGGHQLQAEYADTFLQRQRGLMGRSELASDSGMLFRFDEVRRHCLWMKDTPLPLSAAFFDEDGVLVDVIDLEPFNTQIRCSQRPARFALEMDQGWFAERGVGRGTRLEGIPEE